ncbi:F-box domain-containing protein [Aphelenchoides bicaudatus]|nr:F-box domain-containing protein [Aphelenchoides bicaudatus]
MMKTQLAPFLNKSTMSSALPSTSDPQSHSHLPEEILCRIAGYATPKDRLNLQLVCRRFKSLFSFWPDITSLEIRSDVYDCTETVTTTAASLFGFGTKPQRISYFIKLTDLNGHCYQLRTLQERMSIQMLKLLMAKLTKLEQLTIWDACLGPEFTAIISKMTTITQLRLWNCSRYFEKKTRNKKLLHALLALPALDELLVLDTTSSASNSVTCRQASFDKACAQKIPFGTIKNLQLTGLHLPFSAFQILVERLADSCTRLAIGCTFGKEDRRIDYLKCLMTMKQVNDLDLPPFLFHLNELPNPDGVVEKVLDLLPLKSLGFRHYNSSVLFRFVEDQLPMKIRVLRIHHNANRIPNFLQLGQHEEPEIIGVKKKSSVISHYSILSASRSSISSANAIDTARVVAQGAQASSAGSSGSGTLDSKRVSSLAARRLTIFALAEDTKNGRNKKIKQKCYNGVDVFYLQQTRATQEVFARIASPAKSPHVYSRNLKKDAKVRVIKGDLVKTIPLNSLGMESDYELSDCDE